MRVYGRSAGHEPEREDIYRDFIASKSPDAETREEEVERIGVTAAEEKGTTVFPRGADGRPFLYDYQLKGFFKDSIGMLARAGKAGYAGGKACAALKAYKKIVDGLIFIEDRENPFDLRGMKMDTCSRPLRAMTMQGERVSIAKSETVPEGSTLEFTVLLLDEKLKDVVLECLDYGMMRGMGQWRNSGKGRFRYTAEIEETE